MSQILKYFNREEIELKLINSNAVASKAVEDIYRLYGDNIIELLSAVLLEITFSKYKNYCNFTSYGWELNQQNLNIDSVIFNLYEFFDIYITGAQNNSSYKNQFHYLMNNKDYTSIELDSYLDIIANEFISWRTNLYQYLIGSINNISEQARERIYLHFTKDTDTSRRAECSYLDYKDYSNLLSSIEFYKNSINHIYLSMINDAEEANNKELKQQIIIQQRRINKIIFIKLNSAANHLNNVELTQYLTPGAVYNGPYPFKYFQVTEIIDQVIGKPEKDCLPEEGEIESIKNMILSIYTEDDYYDKFYKINYCQQALSRCFIKYMSYHLQTVLPIEHWEPIDARLHKFFILANTLQTYNLYDSSL